MFKSSSRKTEKNRTKKPTQNQVDLENGVARDTRAKPPVLEPSRQRLESAKQQSLVFTVERSEEMEVDGYNTQIWREEITF